MEATTGVGPLVGRPAERRGSSRRQPDVLARAAARHAADWPRTTRLLPWALFGFMAMIWLVPFDSVLLPVGGPIDITLDRPALVVLVGIWLLGAEGAGLRHKVRTIRSPIHWAFAIFIAVAIVSVLLRGELLVRVGDLELAVRALALLVSYGVFFALAAAIIRPAEVPKMVTAILVMASITALAVVLEYRFGFNPFHDWIGPLFPGYIRPADLGATDSIGRRLMYGPTVQPLAVAVMISLALPFAVSWMLRSEERRQRWLYGAMVVLLVAGALATQKKTSMVGPLVAVLVLIAYRPRQMLRLAPLAVALIAVAHFAAPGALGSVIDQFNPGAVDQVNTTKDRVSDYEAIKPDIAAHPVFGRGYGSYEQKEHRILDNEYLGLVIVVGLVGVLAYLAVFATSFLSAHRVIRFGDPDRAPPALGAAAAITVALVTSAVLDFLSFPQLPYIFCFVAAISYVLGRERLEREIS